MLRLLITKFKKILLGLLMAGLIVSMNPFINNQTVYADDYIKVTVEETIDVSTTLQRACDVVIRPGEWSTKDSCKAGKRVYINEGVNWSAIPTDIPIRKDNDGYFISEADINKKVAIRTYEVLLENGINVKLQESNSKSQDLNAAARLSNKSNPKLYLSFHHNYYEENSTGYFAIYNTNDLTGQTIANRLSDSLKNNPEAIPQKANRANTNNYIGELANLNSTTTGVLLELGFFSNKEELVKICSDEQTDYIANQLANEIINILNENILQ